MVEAVTGVVVVVATATDGDLAHRTGGKDRAPRAGLRASHRVLHVGQGRPAVRALVPLAGAVLPHMRLGDEETKP
eukprot:6585211-Pyramimonas_sp.AAC.1